VIPAASPTNDTSAAGSSFASRFEYFDDEQSGGQSGTRVLSHVAPPKSSNFFNEFGMDSAFPKKSSSSSSKAQVKKSFIFNRTEERDRNQFSIPLCLPVFFLLRLKKQMKQERSFQTPNRFPLPNFSEIRTEMPILTQKLPFRSSRYVLNRSNSILVFFSLVVHTCLMRLQIYQGSAAISSSDLFGHGPDDSNIDITASDLINRISFQVKF